MGRENSPLRERVIFVEGAPRSGTTWLVTLLATHPDIAGVEWESHLFDFGVDRLFDNFEGRDEYCHGLNLYLEREELVDAARDLCDRVLMAMRSHVSGPVTPEFVVEKTPIADGVGGLDLARKRECYPDAWYIHIVRDREAVIRSLMRAPFMVDNSREACAGLWDRTVGGARESLGDLPRYREVSYEQLRADPGETCKALFEWLGVRSGDEVLETARVLSREQYSDRGAASGERPKQSRPAAVSSALMKGVRPLLTRFRQRASSQSGPPPSPLAFLFAQALRERDADALRSLTTSSLQLFYRSADGDLCLRNEHALSALLEIAEQTFARRHVSEWWASAGGGPGEWWTAVPDKPLWTIFFSAIAGDATRADLALALLLDADLVSRVVVITAGPPAGRPVAPAEAAVDASTVGAVR